MVYTKGGGSDESPQHPFTAVVERSGLSAGDAAHVNVEELTANADGLYRLTDLDAYMAKAMAEYENIEDTPMAVKSVAQTESTSQPTSIYNLQGQRHRVGLYRTHVNIHFRVLAAIRFCRRGFPLQSSNSVG